MKNFKILIIIALFFMAGFVSWGMYFKTYVQSDTVNIHTFPSKIGEWVAIELPVTEDEYAILETRNAFSRKYTNSQGQDLFLFIVYSENNRKVSHPPEVCYAGSGFTVVKREVDDVAQSLDKKPLKANKLLMELGKRQQYVYYWFKVGDDFTASYWKQQSLIAFKSLVGQKASSALIRISSHIKDQDSQSSEQAVESFSQAILPLLPEYLL